MKHSWRRLIAGVLTLALCVQLLPEQALAYIAGRTENLTLTGKDGSQITTDESWEETFPYGTFAFQNSQLTIEEGGEPGVLQVYRLGGTTGKAVAYIQYVPAFAQIGTDEYAYANAAGYGDVLIKVEDPLPIAAYQPIGKAPGPFAPEVPVTITVEAPAEGTPDTTGDPAAEEPPEAPAEGGDYTLTVNVQADAYQWYVLGDGWEEAVSGAAEPAFVVDAEGYASYDFYCVYTVDGVRYGSASAKGAAFVEPEEEDLGEIPEDLPLNPDPTYSTVEMDQENPYNGYLFPITFADGEWVKEIRISSPQDDAAEPDKFGTFTIVDCEGASLYDAANTLALRVVDDEAPESSQLGFVVTQAEFDKSAGTAELTVRRTGGKQNVVSVVYATEDGTAVGGRDYSPVSGTLSFYADIDEQTITIPLINDGVESQERLTFQVRLFDVKGGGEENLCTLTEGMDTAQVSLYNTNTAQEENLATMLYDSEAVDLSAQVTEQSGSVAPVEAGPVTGEQVAEPTEELEAVIGYGPDDIVPYTFNYAQPIRFYRSSISNYDGNYWKNYTQLNDNTSLGWEEDRFGVGSWSGDGVSNVDGGKRLSDDTSRRAALSISNISHYYEYISASYYFEAAIGTYGQLVTGREYVYPWTEFNISGNKICGTDAGVTHVKGWPTYDISWHTTGSMSGSWDMGKGSSGELVLGLSKYDSHGSDDDAYCHLRNATLRRRTFSNNLNLTVYTANDADTAGDAAMLTSSSGVYDSMRPQVSIVSGQGGVNSSGRLYVGSRLRIALANTASYSPARPEDAGANYDYTVYLTNGNGDIVARATKGSGNDYYLTMDWGDLNENGLNDQYTLNIVMTRKQSLTLDITPSVDRRVDADGNTLTAIDTSKTRAAWNRFLASGSGGSNITVGRSVSSASKPHFGGITKESRSLSAGDAQTFAWNDQKNIQWINFNRSPEDRIVFNGRTYAGNEQIWLTMADLSVSNLTFYYYHKDFLTSESVMTPTVDHRGLYLDGNGNGMIDGWYNRETGYFVVDDNSGDEFITFLEDGVDYDESMFELVKINGQYRQFFLKAFYTKLPRCLVPQTGQEGRRAQILPAFVSNITDSGNYAELTREQQSYRYIIAGQNRAYANNWAAQSPGDYACSADGLPMYGGEATRMEVLDIPLGGDTSPAEMTEDKKDFTWEPNYRGNLLYAFPAPEPIFIAHSLAGDNIPIASIAGVSDDGTITYEEGGVAKLNGYLGSFAANSTVALCVQEQEQTTAQIAAANGGSAWSGVLDSGANTFAARDGGSGAPNLEAVTIGEMGTFPKSQYLKQSDGQDPGETSIDMEESGNEFEEFNLDMGVKLPSTEIGITDFATIIMDEYEVGFAIGMELGGYNSAGDAGAGGTGGGAGEGEWYGPSKVLKNAGEAMGYMKDFLSSPRQASRDADDSYSDATEDDEADRKFNVKGFAVTFNVSMAFLFKYNPVDNTYYFSQFSVAAAAGLEFTYQHRWMCCPIIYVYITVGASLEIGTGATVERQTKTKDRKLPEGADSMKEGQVISFPTTYKAFDIEFNGKLLVELFEDEERTKPVGKIDDHKFNLGFIKSDGDDAVTVTLLKKDGDQLDGDTPYYVVLTALEDTTVTSLKDVTSMETVSYWSGFEVSPEAFVQVAAGIGVEIMKFEVYIKVSIGCSFTLGSYDTDDKKYEGFSFDEFEFALAAGFQVVLLAFSYEMDMIGYSVSYDGDKNEWKHSWSALGGLYGDDIATLSVTDSAGQTQEYGVHVKLPGSTAYTQEIYTGGDSGITPFAFDPTDKENVPFQLSGYGSSGDAFKLADGLTTGYDYQVVSVDGQNYAVHTVSREGGDLHPVDYTMLVLSRLRLTNEDGKDTYGLVNPVNAENPTPYILLDTKDGKDDGAGDLDFRAWVDGTTIHAAWVSYDAPASLIGGAGTEPTAAKPTLSDGTAMSESNYADLGFKPVEPQEVQQPTDSEPVEPQRKDYYLTAEEYAAVTDPAERDNYVAVNAAADPGTGGDPSDGSGSDGGEGGDPVTPEVAFYSIKASDGSAKYATLTDAEDAYNTAHGQYETDHADWADKNSAYQDYLTAKAAYDVDKAAYDAWLSYFQNLNDYNSQVQSIAAAAAKKTVVKTASFDTANPGTGFTPAAVVSGSAGAHVFLPNMADKHVVVYGKAEHFRSDELTQKVTEYKNYLERAYPDDAGNAAAKSIRDYRLTYQKGLWDVNGKGSKLCVSVDGHPTEIALATGQTLENIEAANIDGAYYVAYTTGEQAYEGSDLVNIRRLYLRTFTVSDTSAVTIGDPLLLRTLCDYDSDSTRDGLYSNGGLTGKYADPYFSNLQFLNGKLGGLQGTEESFTARAMSADETECFLLFEMNGSTYVIPESSLRSITASHSGQIIPFFTPPAEDLKNEEISASTGRAEVTIGADGAGNIAAVYTSAVANTGNNAIYLTKWDPNSQTWGAGTMLAMNHMQVCEDAAANGWSGEETEAAYLGQREGYSGGGMDQFTFSNLQIALGQTKTNSASVMAEAGTEEAVRTAGAARAGAAGESEPEETGIPEPRDITDSTDSSKDTLLVLTQGSMRYLKTREADLNGDGQNETILVPMSDSEALAKYGQGGGHKPGVGVYAISYGVGGQGIGQSSLSLQAYDFSAGSELTAYLSFVNTGDVAIRASKANPAAVELKLYVPQTAEQSGGTSVLASWTLTENVRSGQEVRLSGSCTALTQDLPEGSIFYIEASEDAAYIASQGGTAFLANTLVCGEDGTPVDGDLVVEKKAELALEDVHITSVSADVDGNTTLQVEFLASNRGSETAENVFAWFQYEDADGNYQPLDISHSDLNVSTAQPVVFSLRAADPLQQGILYLKSKETGDNGSLPAGMYRSVTGTITVPPEVYQGSITDSLNLHVELFSGADNFNVYSRESADTYSEEHDEYNSANNVNLTQIEHRTFFTAADQVILALGTTVRLPVAYTTTTGAAPNILAEEVPDTGASDGAQLGILYYESTGAGSGMVVITPSALGSGVIHLKDEITNTIRSIPFKVVGAGEGIDIYKDNGIFTFYNKDKSPYDDTAASGTQNWDFMENAVVWGTGSTQEAPMRSNLSRGQVGASFTFSTMAASIDLYFAGTVRVSSTFPGFTARTCTGTAGNRPTTIRFGSNPDNLAHTVTMEVTGAPADGDGYAMFDRMTETYTQKPPTPSDDGTAPHIYWSRSFPETASIKTGEGTVELTCYVLDDGALANLTLNGTEPENLVKNNDGFWQFTTAVSENGMLAVAATDTSGNRTSRSARVDWFNAVLTSGAISTAPELKAQFQNEDGSKLRDYLTAGKHAYLAATVPENLAEGDTLTASRIVAQETSEGTSELAETALDRLGDGRFDATANGWYILRLRAADGSWRQEVLEMDKVDAEVPIVSLIESEPTEENENEWGLDWRAYKSNPRLTPIAEVKINGEDVDIIQRQTQLAGIWPISYSGSYTLIARDSAGNESTTTRKVENHLPLNLTGANSLTSVENAWNQDENNGVVTVNLTGVTGGMYVEEALERTGKYVGSYEFCVVPAMEVDGEEEPAEPAWIPWEGTAVDVENLETGDYLLCIRDSRDPENENVTVEYPFSVGSDAVTCEAQANASSSAGAPNGSLVLNAAGGKDTRGYYQFQILPLEGEDSPLTDVRELEEDAWEAAPVDSEDLAALVREGLLAGWYQIAVRTMADVEKTDIEDLRALGDAVTAAQERVDAAQQALRDRTEAENQLQGQINTAFSQWNAAVTAANKEGLDSEDKAAADQAAEDAWKDYKDLIEEDPAILAALEAWREANAKIPDDENLSDEDAQALRALEEAYHAAVKSYAQKRALAEAEAEKTAADAALEQAKTDRETKEGVVRGKVSDAYGAESPLWANAFTRKIYLDTNHTHAWSKAWSSNSGYHWHDCTAENCDIPENSGKEGYAPHEPGAAATCETVQVCGVCGRVLMAALGHDYGELIPAVDSTTIRTGMKAHYVCSRCGTYFDENQEPTTEEELTIPVKEDSGGSSTITYPVTGTEPEPPEDSGTSTYHPVTVTEPEHGKVTVSPANAASGRTVTLTVQPDWGYTLNTLKVADSRGKEVKLTGKGNGKYTFTMPGRTVTIEADFVPLSDGVGLVCGGGENCPSHGFLDLGGVDAWYHEAVDYALRNNLMGGYGGGLFGPNNNLTRAQLAQILYNREGRPAVTGNSPFTDVANGVWYSDAITWAEANGIVGGYGNGHFGPNDNITREQLAAILWRYSKSPAATSKELHFNDVDEISGYALDAIHWAVEHGVLNGFGDGRLDPKGLATRAQVAQMLKNFIESQEEST